MHTGDSLQTDSQFRDHSPSHSGLEKESRLEKGQYLRTGQRKGNSNVSFFKSYFQIVTTDSYYSFLSIPVALVQAFVSLIKLLETRPITVY